MVTLLAEQIMKKVHEHLSRVLDAAEVGIPSDCQFKAFRKITLNEFGNQRFLPELETLIQQHQGKARTGQADTAGKEVPR